MRPWELQNTQVTLDTQQQCLKLGQSVQVSHNPTKPFLAGLEVEVLAGTAKLEDAIMEVQVSAVCSVLKNN